ncbi:MAG: hypothetical protein CVU63_22725 [Deltaproteobacteria bacterium HGW-Deltaproteobacteria-20]|nr:MAG: hypothetical protein CVU63_22725 [Deltaproteobacteria bacterium HGW-Deltaproteobacteria-20]
MAPTRLLVIDDDVPFCRLLSKNLTRLGFSPHFASLLESSLQRLQSEDFDVILLDPQRAGMRLPLDWTAFRDAAPQTAVVIATRPASVSMAVACMRLGATDFLQKPVTSVSYVASRLHAAAAAPPSPTNTAFSPPLRSSSICSTVRTAWPTATFPSSSRGRVARAKTCSPAACTPAARQRPGRGSPSIVPPSPTPSRAPSCSATPGTPSPAPPDVATDCSATPMAAPSSSTR